MVLYGYDASVFNSVQGSKNWVAWFDNPNANLIGSINTAYTVGAIFGGFFCGGPIADYLGRKVGMATGCVLVIIATFLQAFAPYHSLACFIAGRVLIGIGQGIALSKSRLIDHVHACEVDADSDIEQRPVLFISANWLLLRSVDRS